jgi:hypothetical protein
VIEARQQQLLDLGFANPLPTRAHSRAWGQYEAGRT